MDIATPRPSSTPAGPSLHDAATLAADRVAYERVVSAGFGLWLDYDWPKKGWNTGDLTKNYFSPDGFETSLRAALEQSDEYVWIYTETPAMVVREAGACRRPAAGLRRRGPARPPSPGRRLNGEPEDHRACDAMLRPINMTAESLPAS